jgi:hypothetical protein
MRSFVLCVALCAFASVRAADDDKALAPIGSGEAVFVAKLTKVTAGPVGLSDPPVRSYTFEVEVGEQLRGPKPTGPLSYTVRSAGAPVFPMDEKWLISARKAGKGWQVTFIGTADKPLLEKAKALAALPAAWALEGGKPVSPWAALKEKAWPKDAPKVEGVACSKTGRPALMAGAAVEFTVEQVPAENPQKFKNDMFGDGKFKLTVKNTSDKPVKVPALLTDGKTRDRGGERRETAGRGRARDRYDARGTESRGERERHRRHADAAGRELAPRRAARVLRLLLGREEREQLLLLLLEPARPDARGGRQEAEREVTPRNGTGTQKGCRFAAPVGRLALRSSESLRRRCGCRSR